MEEVRLNDIILKDYIDKSIIFNAVVTGVEVRGMKNGGNFLKIEVRDLAALANITQFDCSKEAAANFVKGKVYTFSVDVKEYKKDVNGVSCLLQGYAESTLNSGDFLKWEDGVQNAYQMILSYCEMIKHTAIGKLTVSILNKYWTDFTKYPAASSFHHKYLGGLLVHTCCVAELSKRMGDFYNQWYGDDTVNMNLLICGALLHDIGKLDEFNFNEDSLSVEYSNDSFLMNHITSGMLIIQQEATLMEITDRQEVKELIHLIASHHGRLEWGSPIETHCIEADILSYCDQTDASVNRRIDINKSMICGSGEAKYVGGTRINNYRVTREQKKIEL
jgi:3'-5' exoribonuclease